jgi:thiamine kinase-like enzyme
VFARYVETRLEALAACHGGAVDGIQAALRQHLRREFLGGRVRVGLCHGDAKLANCLFQSGRLTGVIDWDMSEHRGLCAVDVAALISSTVLQYNRASLTDVLDRNPGVDPHLSTAVDAYHRRMGTTPQSFRTMLLLYWLDRVWRHQTFGRATRDWQDRFVRPVTEWLQARGPL